MSAARRRPPAFWYGDASPPLPARAASALYGGALALRERLERFGILRAQRVSRPVVVVGNLIAGGSGKTPRAIALVERLRRQGRAPGIATRGMPQFGHGPGSGSSTCGCMGQENIPSTPVGAAAPSSPSTERIDALTNIPGLSAWSGFST